MRKLIIFSLFVLVAPATLYAQNVTESGIEVDAAPYVHSIDLYPPVHLVTNYKPAQLKAEMDELKAFEDIAVDVPGRPITVRVLLSNFDKNGGAETSSAILAAATLGLVPIVNKTVFRVRYDVFVRRDSILTYHYDLPNTEVSSIWSDREDSDLKTEQVEFFRQTVDRFMHELKDADEARHHFAEYFEFYGSL